MWSVIFLTHLKMFYHILSVTGLTKEHEIGKQSVVGCLACESSDSCSNTFVSMVSFPLFGQRYM